MSDSQHSQLADYTHRQHYAQHVDFSDGKLHESANRPRVRSNSRKTGWSHHCSGESSRSSVNLNAPSAGLHFHASFHH